MSAEHMVNRNQLKMFMLPSEVHEYVNDYGDAPFYSSPEAMWADKEFDNNDGITYDDEDDYEDQRLEDQIAERGVETPLRIDHHVGREDFPHVTMKPPWLADGHHRLLAAESTAPLRYIPIEHQ